MEINRAGEGRKKDNIMVILGTMLKRRLYEEMPFEQRPTKSEDVSTARLWEKSMSEGIQSFHKSLRNEQD